MGAIPPSQYGAASLGSLSRFEAIVDGVDIAIDGNPQPSRAINADAEGAITVIMAGQPADATRVVFVTPGNNELRVQQVVDSNSINLLAGF